MALIVSGLRVELDDSEADILRKLRKKLGWKGEKGPAWQWQRRSLDARKKSAPHFEAVLKVEAAWSKRYLRDPDIRVCEELPRPAIRPLPPRRLRPLVVGSGPAGLFAALRLAEAGLPPLILERGEALASRRYSVQRFREEGLLKPESNVQFGEGGAGTFSDGKLLTRSKGSKAEEVLEIFARFGAPEEILWLQRPHIGTDVLLSVLERFHQELEKLGAEFRFGWKLRRPLLEEGRLVGAEIEAAETESASPEIAPETLSCDRLILAVGHSARDSFRHFAEAGLRLEAKAFAVGFRIEHLQCFINKVQLGAAQPHPRIGAAEYRLADAAFGSSVYSFCMCPGGEVIAAASEPEGCVTNGMSYHARADRNANAAILCAVSPEELGSGLWAGLDFQRSIEKAAYRLGGGGYAAPVQRLGDYLEALSCRYPDDAAALFRDEKGHPLTLTEGAGRPEASCRPAVLETDLSGLYPRKIALALGGGILRMGRKLQGFADREALLTAPETRSSSPLRILREAGTLEALGAAGIYPCGEGAGYAGGITSSAADGLAAAEALLESCR